MCVDLEILVLLLVKRLFIIIEIQHLSPTLIPLSGVSATCFSSCCDKDSAIIFLRPAACLTSTLLETGVGANDCKCNWDQRLNVPSEARRSSI
jgi:hypothetical protein